MLPLLDVFSSIFSFFSLGQCSPSKPFFKSSCSPFSVCTRVLLFPSVPFRLQIFRPIIKISESPHVYLIITYREALVPSLSLPLLLFFYITLCLSDLVSFLPFFLTPFPLCREAGIFLLVDYEVRGEHLAHAPSSMRWERSLLPLLLCIVQGAFTLLMIETLLFPLVQNHFHVALPFPTYC